MVWDPFENARRKTKEKDERVFFFLYFYFSILIYTIHLWPCSCSWLWVHQKGLRFHLGSFFLLFWALNFLILFYKIFWFLDFLLDDSWSGTSVSYFLLSSAGWWILIFSPFFFSSSIWLCTLLGILNRILVSVNDKSWIPFFVSLF